MRYLPLYRCVLCREEYKDHHSAYSETEAIEAMRLVISGSSSIRRSEFEEPFLQSQELHRNCKRGVGVACLVGFEKEEA